jgi:phytanoyl-CoA dioxygenase PhyH
MSEADFAAQLREQGVLLLRGLFAQDALASLREAARKCFEAVETDDSLAEQHRFNRFSHSVLLNALTAFGCTPEELTAPLSAADLTSLFTEVMGCDWVCKMEQSWLRKKFAPDRPVARKYHLQGWHQDGALGVSFPPESGLSSPISELLTCWIPLDACGADSPGLEFIRGPQPTLLHFTELDDTALRRRFAPEGFWAPELEFGDCLIFLNNVLHRTYTNDAMQRDRISVEYRIFPR